MNFFDSKVMPQQVDITLGDIVAAAIATVSVTCNQTRWLYNQWSSRPSARLTSSRNGERHLSTFFVKSRSTAASGAGRVGGHMVKTNEA